MGFNKFIPSIHKTTEKGLAMSGKLGSEPLGKFYTGKTPKKRREWRGF